MSKAQALSARQIQIVDAAMRLFSRYGVRRTTMNDIAIEAEVARQTLYNTFANKDDVLRALVRHLADKTCAGIKAGLPSCDSLEAEIQLGLHHIAVVVWDALAESNHAEDIVEGVSGASKGEFEAAEERYRKVFQSMLKPYSDAIRATGTTPSALADFVVTRAMTAKHKARDRSHLLRLLNTLTCATVSVAKTAAR
ncbi:MAG: TetR family transcriptional regulator [Pseudomonadota bacterium]